MAFPYIVLYQHFQEVFKDNFYTFLYHIFANSVSCLPYILLLTVELLLCACDPVVGTRNSSFDDLWSLCGLARTWCSCWSSTGIPSIVRQSAGTGSIVTIPASPEPSSPAMLINTLYFSAFQGFWVKVQLLITTVNFFLSPSLPSPFPCISDLPFLPSAVCAVISCYPHSFVIFSPPQLLTSVIGKH